MLEGVWNITLKISSTSVSGIGIYYIIGVQKQITFTVSILSDHPSSIL